MIVRANANRLRGLEPSIARALLALLPAVLVAACAQATEIVLVVDTDLGVPGELTRVEIDVLNDRTAPVRTGVDFTMPGASALPLVLGITARRPDAPVVVSVRGYLETGEILTRDARTSIVPGSSRVLRVMLARRCLGHECPLDETCDETGCRPIEIPGGELPGWGGSAARNDGEACTPRDEVCNLYDDDCDGMMDEGIMLLTDPVHCGRCGHPCDSGACENGFCAGETPELAAAGGAHTCVLRENGNVACFGWNLDGQLGAPGIASRPIATDLAVSGVSAIAAGGAFTCLLGATGQVRCLGDGDEGALGTGESTDARIAAPVMGTSSYRALGAGVAHACAVTTMGSVECWGRNDAGQIGDGSTTTALVPTPAWPADLTNATAIAAGLRHTCALRMDGTVVCWGRDARGQLGDGVVGGFSTPPTPAVGLDMVTAIAAGRDFTCALRTAGTARTVLCWGANDLGQLGAAGSLESATPIAVTGITDAIAISAAPGGTHACALRTGGVVSCWGSNASGQLGDGTTDASTEPLDAMNLPAAIAVAAGGLDDSGRGHTCAILGTGAVHCWGDGGLGQNGSVAAADLDVPTPVAGLP